jgi:hypothetical protein
VLREIDRSAAGPGWFWNVNFPDLGATLERPPVVECFVDPSPFALEYRLSDDGSVRHTSVELLVESTPVASRARTLVAIKIGASDKNTRTLLMACGAQWVAKERYWLLPRMVAKNLRLLKYIVPSRG